MAGNKEQFKKAMSQGHSAAWDMDWENAAAYYRHAVSEFPDDQQAVSSLGSALIELGRYDEALPFYQKAAKLAPDDPIPLEKLAAIFEMQENYAAGAEASLRAAEVHLRAQVIDKAVENWNQVIRLDPENLRARSRLATVYEKQGRNKQAVAQYLAVASLLQHAGDRGRAQDLVQRAMRLDPESNEAVQALGLLRAGQPLPKPAHKPKRRAAKPEKAPDLMALSEPEPEDDYKSPDPIQDSLQKALSSLASIMFESEDEPRSQANRLNLSGTGPLGRMRREHDKIVLHLSQTVDLQTRGKLNEASAELEKAINAGLDQSSGYFMLGYFKEKEGRVDNAMRNLQVSVNHPDYALASRILLGRLLLAKKRPQDSAVQFMEALRIADTAVIPRAYQEQLHQLYEPLIEAYSRKRDKEQHTKFATSIEQLLVRENWREYVVQARQQLPEPGPGIPPTPLAEILTQAQSTQVVAMLSSVHDLARRGLFRMAMEQAYYALQYAPTYLPLHSFMGEILLQQERVDDAIIKFNTVARAYSSRGEAPRAIELYKRITQLAPLDLAARQRLIEQLTAAGMMEDTIREYLDLGDVHYRLAELDRARETYQKALNIAQQSKVGDHWKIEILHHLADIDMQRLDWQRALKIFQQIAQIDPADEKAAMGLVDLNFRLLQETEALAALGNYIAYLNSRGKEEQALHSLESLLESEPDRIALKRTLAEQYKRMGRSDSAIIQFDEIGDALAESGDVSGAILAIQSIIELDPPNSAEYQKLLEHLRQM